MVLSTTLTSPRLEILRQAVEAGNTAALDVFWQEISARGTPLTEPIPGSDQSLVTFLWQAKDESGDVAVVSNLSGRDGASEAMARLPGSDVWYKTYTLFNHTRESYQIALEGSHVADPLNPVKHIFPVDEDTGVGGWESSVFELADAPPDRWSKPLPDVPAGQVTKHRLRSALIGDEYPIWVYTPPGYPGDEKSYGYLVTTDGSFYAQVLNTPTILDNLLAAGMLPPLIAIMVGSLYSPTRPRDLGCSPDFAEFLVQELIPWARQHFRLTNDPEKAAIVGVSRGGLMAPYLAFRFSDAFGNVIAQSGYYDWKPDEDSEPGWLPRQYAESPQLPLRFHLDAGLYETEVSTLEGPPTDILASTRHFCDLLQTKGYAVHYSEFAGGHGPMNWSRTLADGLLALFGNEAYGKSLQEPEKSPAKPGMHTIQAISRAVHPSFAMLAGCQLGVFTALKDGSLNADQIASALEVDATRLRPLLYALVSAGLLAVDQHCFSNTEESNTYLVKGSPTYIGPVYDVWAMIWAAEMKSAESIRTGVAQCRHLFDYANRSPEELEKIFRGLHGPSMAYGQLLAQRFDFSACNTVLDVGGGSGGLVISLLQANAHLTATVVEFPTVAPVTQLLIDEAGMADRIQVASLDAVKTPVPGRYDSAVLSKVLQNLSAEECQIVLKHVGQALNPGGTVFIFGAVLDDTRLTPLEMATVNLFFINAFDGGQAFTESEHRTWLSEAGFENIERETLPDQLSLITARRRLFEAG